MIWKLYNYIIKMEEFLNDVKDYCEDNNIEIEFGIKEKVRRKEITESLDVLIKANETKKLKIVKKLIRNYMLVDHLINNLRVIPYYEEYSKSGTRGVYEYMDDQLDTFKRCLTGSMLALAKDEELEDFYKKLMRRKDDEEDDEDDYEWLKNII